MTHIVRAEQGAEQDAILTIPTIKSENSEVSTFSSLLKSKDECEELFKEWVFFLKSCLDIEYSVSDDMLMSVNRQQNETNFEFTLDRPAAKLTN